MAIVIVIFSVCILPIKMQSSQLNILNVKNTNRIKGLACIMVVVGHASFQLGGKGVFQLTYNLGFLAVGVFFFFSGYGLVYGLINKKSYLQGFLKKRFVRVALPFWCSNIIFIIYYIIQGHNYSRIDIINNILGIRLLVGHNWYIWAIVIYYLLFFIIASVLKNNTYTVVVVSICVLAMIIISQIVNIPYLPHYIISSGTFVFGMIVAKNKRIVEFIVSLHTAYIVLIGIIFVAMYAYVSVLKFHLPSVVGLVQFGQFICPLLLIVIIIHMLSLCLFGNIIIDRIGEASYEIYLLQQLAIDFGKHININKGIELGIIVLVSVLIGYCFHMIYNHFYKKIYA